MVQYMRRHAERQANLFVVNATTPAQLFHVLRRQMNRPFHKCTLLPKQIPLHEMAPELDILGTLPCGIIGGRR